MSGMQSCREMLLFLVSRERSLLSKLPSSMRRDESSQALSD